MVVILTLNVVKGKDLLLFSGQQYDCENRSFDFGATRLRSG